MPSTLSTAKGHMVVTKIVPLEDHCDIPITNVDNSESKKPTTYNEKVPEMIRLFQKGYPLPLGIVQIFLGIMTLALGVLVILSSEFLGEVPLSLGIFFMISGSISAAAHEGKRICLIKGTLAMNIISSLVALAGFGYFCIELAKQPEECKREEWQDRNYRYWQCVESVKPYKAVVNGVKGLLLVMAVFQFCVSTTISVFSAKAIRQDSTDQLGGPVRLVITETGADESSTVPLLTVEEVTAPTSP